jgi:hypothetical protein
MDDRCELCRFFVEEEVLEYIIPGKGDYFSAYHEKWEGFCRRYPKYLKKYKLNWCGEFKCE